MRLVIITHGYAPALNARAFRWTALAEYWAAAGHDVEVITVRSGNAPRSETVNGVRVHRVGFYFERIGVAVRRSSHQVGGERSKLALVKRTLALAARKLYDATWKQIYWPDFAAIWIPFAAWKARRIILRSAPPTAVISVSLPFSSHVAALLAGARGANVPWIVDVGDPFSFAPATPLNNPVLYSGLNARMECIVFRSASAVAVTTTGTAEEYLRLFGNARKVSVIPPLLSIDVSAYSEGIHPKKATRLVYIGTLNRNIRSPDRLLAIFAALIREGQIPDLQLDFYGETGDCAASFEGIDEDVASRIHIHGLVARDVAIKAARSALALVNIGNTTVVQLPSKLVEYVATGRPILNLTSTSNDSSSAFLAEVSGVLTLRGDQPVASEARMVREFLCECVDSDFMRTPNEWLARFSLPSTAAAYEQVIAGANEIA